MNDYSDRVRWISMDDAEPRRTTRGWSSRATLWEPLGRLFQRFDVLLCPTMATDGFRAGEAYLEGGMDVGDGHVSNHILGAMTLPFNVQPWCPVLSGALGARRQRGAPPASRWWPAPTTT